MSITLKICGLFLLVSLAMGTRATFGRYEGIDDNIDANDLTPPQDPAINAFPKAPVVPLIPTCSHFGYFRDPFNCGKFYYCQHSQAIPSTFWCQHGLIFNERTEKCEDPAFVDC